MNKPLILPAIVALMVAGCGISESESSDNWRRIAYTNKWEVYENDSVILCIPNSSLNKPYIVKKKSWCGKEGAK